MSNMHYRTVSCWITWEDLDFPNSGIKRKFLDRAKADHEAGVEMVMIFGCHFRWDFLCCFDTLHALLKFIVDAYHACGILVCDHHSAVLTHRPRGWAGREHTFQKNHHHVPFTPDRSVAAQLSYDGTSINSWRERRVDDDTPMFVECYQSEIYCPNNPDFRRAYQSYAARLFRETGIDGLMCDDVCRYGQWAACGCEHCRASFRELTGKTLPPATDWDFWGNFDNPDFRRWVAFRHTVGRDFLEGVRRAIPEGKLLTSCCSGSTGKSNDASALDMAIWNPPLNTLMLEMCGSLTETGPGGIPARVADIQLQHTLARAKNIPVLGAGYAYYPDEGFLVWSLNRFFNNEVWISNHKARLGIDYDAQKAMPDEAEIASEAFRYEARYPELFEVEDVTPVALYYSPASRSFNGDAWEDYAAGFQAAAKELFLRDSAFTVAAAVPDPKRVPHLLLTDCDCLSDAELAALEDYRARGGTLWIAGLCGSRNELGDRRESSFTTRWGVTPRPPEIARDGIDRDKFFAPWGWNIHRSLPAAVDYTGTPVPAQNGFHHLAERVFWTPLRAHDDAARKTILDGVLGALPPSPVRIALPGDLRCRVYRQREAGCVVHVMPTAITTVPHPTCRFQGTGPRIVQEVHYAPLRGTIALEGDFTQAVLYSPDLADPRVLPVRDGRCEAQLHGLKRFFSVRLR